VNVHDLFVIEAYRHHGIARLLLEAVERDARERGCCKLTLEVQENNHPARALYASLGFTDGKYTPEAGAVLFRVKKLASA
jgi:ribosomal protein S18 acetylase RimI-like enzyme